MKDMRTIRDQFRAVHLVVFLWIFLAGCGCAHLVSYYDAVSYKNLTDLKGEMKVFFEKSGEAGAHGESDFSTLQGK